MSIENFKKLLSSGFDIEFNINNVFYSFTKGEIEGKTAYFVGNENHSLFESFDTIDVLLEFRFGEKTIRDIILELNDDEICY